MIDPPLTSDDRHGDATSQALEVIATLSAADASTRKIGSALAPLISDLAPMTLGALLRVAEDELTGRRVDVREWCTGSHVKRALTVSGFFDARRLVEAMVTDVLDIPGVGNAMAGEIVAALALAVHEEP